MFFFFSFFKATRFRAATIIIFVAKTESDQ